VGFRLNDLISGPFRGMRQRDANRANSHRDKSCGPNLYFPGFLRRTLVRNQSSDRKIERVGGPWPAFRFDSSFPESKLALEECAHALGSELQQLSYHWGRFCRPLPVIPFLL
jgi:hypothetical protein